MYEIATVCGCLMFFAAWLTKIPCGKKETAGNFTIITIGMTVMFLIFYTITQTNG